MTTGAAGHLMHASCVDHGGRGLLILGPSGSGKSALALELMAMGARLVADDRTLLTLAGEGVEARCPPALLGMIEARGLGLLNADPVSFTRIALAVDLGSRETERLPPIRHISVLGKPVDLVLGQEGRHFPAALLRYLTAGRRA